MRLVFHIGVIERATACSTLFWILDDQAPVVVIDGFHNHEVIFVEPGHERGNFRVSELSALRVSNIARAEDDTGAQTVRHSKTDEEGQGAVLFLGAPTLAPVDAWFAAVGARDTPGRSAGCCRGPRSARAPGAQARCGRCARHRP